MQLVSLAQATGAWAVAAAGLGAAAEAAASVPKRAAELRMAQGHALEEQVKDAAAALEAFSHALELDPEDLPAMVAVTRTAAKAGNWPAAARAAGQAMVVRERFEPSLIAELESHATDAESWTALARGLASVVASLTGVAEGAADEKRHMPRGLAQSLEMVVAGWYRDHANDLDAAEQAARRAVDLRSDQARGPRAARIAAAPRARAGARGDLEPHRRAERANARCPARSCDGGH